MTELARQWLAAPAKIGILLQFSTSIVAKHQEIGGWKKL